jgi:hypothetical protein
MVRAIHLVRLLQAGGFTVITEEIAG